MIGIAVFTVALTTPVATSRDGVDVVRYELAVRLGDGDLDVAATIHATGRPPPQWTLALVPEMTVTAARCGSASIAFTRSGARLTLDGTAITTAKGAFAVTIACQGAPAERFPPARGGYVRSVVGPETTYVRSQVAWHPRAEGDPALYSITVDAPADRAVRTAGDFGAPRSTGARGSWSFTTATLCTPVPPRGFAPSTSSVARR